MSEPRFRVTPLDATYKRISFNSGSDPLDRYFQRQVMQDVHRRGTACFVALTSERRIAGYYTLSAASMLLADLPSSIGKKLPRYPSVPTVRMGRLAVDQDFKGQGLGGALLAGAMSRAGSSEIAAYALVVDAKDEGSAAFYLHHGFIPLPDSPLTLFLP